MTISYKQIQSIQGLGGYVTPEWLTPVKGTWEPTGTPLLSFIQGNVDELSIMIFGEVPGDYIFRLPPVYKTGQVCGCKLITQFAVGNPIPVETSNQATEALIAGIEDQQLLSMEMSIRLGIGAIFVSYNEPAPLFFGITKAWILASYMPGSTFSA